LEIPGAEKLTGRGIYYGAALVEAASCKDEDVYVVGGANSAGQAALHFAKFACKVTMLVRASSLEASMSKYLIDEIERTSNIVIEPNTQVLAAEGEDHLESLRIRGPEGESVRKAASVFVFIGAVPGTDWLPESILRDEKGFILAGPDLSGPDMAGADLSGPDKKAAGKFGAIWKEKRAPYLLESSIPGVFVAGDVRHGSVKRAASAVGEGSIAVQFAHQYLASF
jgi:thioredoxin reductase (NADPH)